MKSIKNLSVIATVGGGGTRLYPLTLDRPKPLLNMCGSAVISRFFESLASQGCRDFIIASKGWEITNRLKDFFKDGAGFSTRLKLRPAATFRYQNNYEDKGSADALRYNLEFFDIQNDVLVVSGDNIADLSVNRMREYHQEKGAMATVGIKKLEGDLSSFGVAVMDQNFRIRKFVEKPKAGEVPSNFVNTSMYIFAPEIREVLKGMGDLAKDIGHDLIPYLVENGYPVYGYPIEGYWVDIGTPGNFYQTVQDILHGSVSNISLEEPVSPGEKLWIHPSTFEQVQNRVGTKIHLECPVKIGANCRIGDDVAIKSSFIGDDVMIGEGTTITNSVVLDFVNIGDHVKLNKCIVGEYSQVGGNSIIDQDLPVEISGGSADATPVIGSGVKILERSVLGPKKRVAPLRCSHQILATGRFKELGYDRENVYFIEA